MKSKIKVDGKVVERVIRRKVHDTKNDWDQQYRFYIQYNKELVRVTNCGNIIKDDWRSHSEWAEEIKARVAAGEKLDWNSWTWIKKNVPEQYLEEYFEKYEEMTDGLTTLSYVDNEIDTYMDYVFKGCKLYDHELDFENIEAEDIRFMDQEEIKELADINDIAYEGKQERVICRVCGEIQEMDQRCGKCHSNKIEAATKKDIVDFIDRNVGYEETAYLMTQLHYAQMVAGDYVVEKDYDLHGSSEEEQDIMDRNGWKTGPGGKLYGPGL